MTSSSSLSAALTNLPYISFLSVYPHPAFILRSRRLAGKGAPSLEPVFGNPAFRGLLFGPDADTTELPLGNTFLRALETVEQARKLTDWLETCCSVGKGTNAGETLLVELKPAWTNLDAAPVQLELTHTMLDNFTVCTSIAHTPLPLLSPASHILSGTQPSRLKRERDVHMRLTDFPSMSQLYVGGAPGATPTSFAALMRTPVPGGGYSSSSGSISGSASGSAPSSRSPDRWTVPAESFVKPQITSGGMREMVESYDWHSTPLGPRSSWPASLRAAVSYMLAHPYPQALWWGEEATLIYNDAYKEMAGSKHPAIFAQRGSVSWGELWETIGPLAKRVLAGEAISRHDDLLFFHRLTDAKLPEETYHSWSWVPVEQEDGTVGGFLNGTFESTKKVIAERRMIALRDLGHKAGLSRTQSEFASAVLSVLEGNTLDVPFAAFYFASTTDSSKYSHDVPRTSYLCKSVDKPPVRVELRRSGTVGIPASHPAVPPMYELLLDPLTLRMSPKALPKNISPTEPGQPLDSLPSAGSSQVSLLDLNSQTSIAQISSSKETNTSLASSSSGEEGAAVSVESGSTPTHMQLAPVPPLPTAAERLTAQSATSSTVTSKIPQPAMIWPFDLAFSTKRAAHVPHIPDYVVEGFEVRGWGEHAREAVVVPIVEDDADLPVVVLILGLNSRRPFDEDYAAWVELLRLSLNSLLTAVKGREADLIRAEHLAQLDDAKTAFFSNASHELRTPLTLILGPLQDCLVNVTEPKVIESLKMASRNVSRLSRLVDSLMDFSKLAAHRLEGHFRPVQLGSFTADLASLFRSVIEKSRITYVVECDVNERKISYIDPDFWEKIVFNLIGNAFKYTMRGSIQVTLHYDGYNAYFSVKDTGVGIPQQDIGKVFERFYRVDATSRSHEGTGIGLALTRELVKLHGGSLSATSVTETDNSEDHGSTFMVTIPLGKSHLPGAHVVNDAPEFPHNSIYARGIVDEATHWCTRSTGEERTPSDTSESGGSSEGSSRIDPNTLFFTKSDIILLVDDNSDMRHYIRSLFSPFCKVVEASHGQEAVDILDRVKPNLILSDVMMPVLDGYGLIASVRQKQDMRLIPIILVTAKESEEAKVEGLMSGADDYISKPFTGREIIARVHLQMQLGKRRIELEAKFLERTREIQLLSDLSPVGIIRADTDGQTIYANQRWREISGLSNDAPAEEWMRRVCPENSAAVEMAWARAVEDDKGAALEFQFDNGNYAKGQFEPLCTNFGESIGVIGTITDISDQRLYEATQLALAQEREAIARKRAEEAEQRRVEADERRRGQELLIDVTSHELRQPVSAILNCSSLVRTNLGGLRDELADACLGRRAFRPTDALIQGIDDDLDALDAIYQCGLAQERIANDVLSLSRIQLQVLSIHPVDFQLVAEVERIVSIFHNEVKMKRINLQVQFGESIRKLGVSKVCSDKSRFGQVITNLLSNGIKFTDTSSEQRDIIVTVDVSRKKPDSDGPCVPPIELEEEIPLDPQSSVTIFVFVSVKDSGPGLRPEDLALLFQRFQQGSNSHNVFGGSGLGLFVSRKLCDLLGGRIDVDSIYGEGATFRFFIEAKTAPLAVDATAPSMSSAPSLRSAISTQSPSVETPRNFGTPTAPLLILITEDNLINQTVLNRQLKKALASSDPSDGGSRRCFDAILMDCEMPVMDGLTAVREIRKMEASGELPSRNRIFALTGNARSAQVQSAREAGMDDVIIKPYKLDELIAKLQGLDT